MPAQQMQGINIEMDPITSPLTKNGVAKRTGQSGFFPKEDLST